MAQAILFNQADNPLQTCADRYKNCSITVQDRLLRYVGDTCARLHLQRAIVRPLHTAQDLEHGGFASAVATDQAHALLGFEGKVSVVEQRDVPERQLGVK
jgi:hypothetical protein